MNHGPYVIAVPEKGIHCHIFTNNVKADLIEGYKIIMGNLYNNMSHECVIFFTNHKTWAQQTDCTALQTNDYWLYNE